MIKKIKPLVIGIGVAGKRHLDSQLNLGNITGIFTTNPQKAASLKKKNHIIVFDNLEQGIEWANLVHICTPDNKHTEFVAKALNKEKRVLCEKPFTTNLKDALYLQGLSHKNKVDIFIGQNYRLTPTFAETKKRIAEGQLGKIKHVETTYFHDKSDFQRRYQDNYFLYSGGSHAIDLALWILDEQTVNISAHSKSNLNFDINLEFSSGISGKIRLDASLPRSISGTELIVYGEKGILTSHNKSDKLSYQKDKEGKNHITFLPNTKTFTIPMEIKIINDYLLGKTDSFRPLPNIDEAVKVIEILDFISKACEPTLLSKA